MVKTMPRLTDLGTTPSHPDLIRKLPTRRIRDCVGDVHGDWTVVGFAGYIDTNLAYKIECVCGKSRVTRHNHLRRLRECSHVQKPGYLRNFFYDHFSVMCSRWRVLETFEQDVGERPDGKFINWNPDKPIGPKNYWWGDTSGGTHHKVFEVGGIKGTKGTQALFAKRLGITRQAMTHRMKRYRDGHTTLQYALTSPKNNGS